MNNKINIESLKKYNSVRGFFTDKQIDFLDRLVGTVKINGNIEVAEC
jgi:hypothetical protein